MRKDKVLVIEHDVEMCKSLKSSFEKGGYNVDIVQNGSYAIKLLEEKLPDIVLLDINVPVIDGWKLCKYIRKRSDCVIILVLEKNSIDDKILALNLGADDYIIKPFEVREVLAKIKTILRRIKRFNKDIFKSEYEKLFINIKDYKVIIDGKNVKMPPREIELLYFLASRPNEVFTRDTLLDELWGVECYVDMRTVDVHIKRLRKKLNGISDKWELKTIWGVGYEFITY